MNKRKIQKIFKNALMGIETAKAPADAKRFSHHEDEYFLEALDAFAEDICELCEDYAIAQNDEDFDPEDCVYADQETALEDYRHKAFEFLEEAANNLNCTVSDICAATGFDYVALIKAYTLQEGELYDDDLLFILQQIHEETLAYREDLLQGYRHRDTRISTYLENISIELYRENTRDSLSLDAIEVLRN